MEKTALYRRIVAAFVVTGGHEQNPRAKRPRLDETRPVEQPVEEPRGSKGDVSHLKGPPTLKDEKEAESRFIRDHAGDDEAIVKYFDGMRQYGPRLGISRIARWRRAEKFGDDPPQAVLDILLRKPDSANKITVT